MQYKGFLPPLNGLVLLDKPKGFSSHAALTEAKRRLCQEKAGHGGTLDPLASGVLPIFFGSWTKLANYCLADTKEYRAIIKLGIKTDSGDSDGQALARKEVPPITPTMLRDTEQQFLGQLEQTPPAFSAIKIQGKPSYKLAAKTRKSGVPMKELPPRFVEIYRLSLRMLDSHHIDVKVKASKGTYVRTLAEQLATHFDTYGHLVALRRTAVGNLRSDMSVSLAQLRADGKGWIEIETLLPNVPKAKISYEQQDMIAFGRSITLQPQQVDTHNCDTMLTLSPEGEVVALGSMEQHEQPSGIFHPRRVFVTG